MARRAALAALIVLAACTADPASQGADVAAEVGCHSCHMDAASDLAPSLNDIWGTVVDFEDGTSAVVDESYVRESIVDPQAQIVAGYSDARMPTFSLSDEEVDQLVEYVRGLS